MDPELAQNKRVSVDIEVVYLNLSKSRRLIVGGLAQSESGRYTVLHGPLQPGEQPTEAARRLLEAVAGIPTGLHAPELVGVATHPDRQADGHATTITYVVLGRTPTDSRLPWYQRLEIDSTAELDGAVDHADSIRAARATARDLLATRSLAIDLLPHPDKPFRLQDLHGVYQAVVGPDIHIDLANFRRKVERCPDFVRRTDPPRLDERPRAGRGRPAHWYLRGGATTIDPPIRFAD